MPGNDVRAEITNELLSTQRSLHLGRKDTEMHEALQMPLLFTLLEVSRRGRRPWGREEGRLSLEKAL